MISHEAAHRVVMHIQASANVGMGHLARSSAVRKQLTNYGIETHVHLDADATGHQVAAGIGLTPASLPNAPGPIIIDAVNLPEHLLRRATTFCPRILISPVFEHPEVPTHVLVREASDHLRSGLPIGTQLITSVDFGFVTTEGLTPQPHKYDALVVGICLSGGVTTHDLDDIIRVAAACQYVTEVRVIDRRLPRMTASTPTPVRHVDTTPAPWEFLHGINLFITGDGVMVAEGAAQAIPTISLTTRERRWKNASLAATGAVKQVNSEPLDAHALQLLLTRPGQLRSMHDAAQTLNGSERAGALAEHIAHILRKAAA